MSAAATPVHVSVTHMFGFDIDPASAQRLVWTLAHFLWQGAGLGIALAVVLACMRRASAAPAVRYVAGCSCLLLMAACPLVTFYALHGSFDDPGPLVMPDEFDHLVAPARGPSTGSSTASTLSHVSARLRSALQPLTPLLATIWLGGTVAIAVIQMVRWFALQRAVRSTSAPLDPEWEELSVIPGRVGLRYSVRFVRSTLVDAPATLGWIKPLVLLPASVLSGLPKDYVEALVAHELAHVRRWDYLVNLLQTALETLLFFHPAVWWVSSCIRVEREHCCDALAARVSGGPVAYASALTALEDLRLRLPAFAMGARGGSLWDRVIRLVGEPADGIRRRRRGVAPAAMLVTATIASLLAAQLFSGAVASTPVRGVDDVHSLCGRVYEVLDIASLAPDDSSHVWLAALHRSLAARHEDSLGEGETIPEADEALVEALLDRSRPDQLPGAILPRMTLARPHAYQTRSDWAYGTYQQRLMLIRELWARAGSLSQVPGASDRSVAHARAAVLLSAQEIAVFGVIPLAGLLDDPKFAALTRLDERQFVRLRRHVEDHEVVTRACRGTREQVERAVATLAATTKPATAPSTSLTSAVADLDAAASLCSGRPDLQWAVASSAQRLFAFDSAPNDVGKTDWARRWTARTPGQVHFHRWLNEAVAEQPNRAVRQSVGSDQLRVVKRRK
jgi:beta-lactamase regulating signal transducer with metallopeptidase domain